MNKEQRQALLAKADYTLLGVTATEADYIKLCDEAVEYNVASVCVPPSRVALCANHLAGRVPVCAVVGFPNGYMDSRVKAYEAQVAIHLGATEIDMVIDIGRVKDADFDYVLEDIRAVRVACRGYVLNVIIEMVHLTLVEKIKLCAIVSDSGADYIKTSTGFDESGATFEDVALICKNVQPHVKVKTAGGITTLEDALRFVEMGANRLGTDRIIKLVQGLEGSGY
ncbi:MAG: deoxyribose-phosphate aldolase [Defluviitaleaceae bacterium]|nr:deoxyribose-phosphate aldolase [Defluviitaleaceae bacterium]